MPIEDRIKARLDALAAEIAGELEARLKAAAAELSAAAAEERVTTEAEAMARLADQMATTREDAKRTLEAEVARVTAEAEQRTADEVDRLRAEAHLARSEADAATAVLQEERARALEVEAQLADALEARRRSQAQAHAATEAAVAKARAEERRSIADAHGAERERMLASLDRLASAIRRLDDSPTLTDVFGTLADAASQETARVALLVASGEQMRVWRLSGFGSAPTGAELSAAELASLGRTGLPFAPLVKGRAGRALPIIVGGQIVALLYADDGDAGAEHLTPSVWPETIEVLARHAAARLEALTALRTAQVLGTGRPIGGAGGPRAGAPMGVDEHQSARRYAKLLVSEIKLYNEGAVRVGREHRDLYDRLRAEIDRARRLYEERVTASPATRSYFDEELVQTLADGDASLFGSTLSPSS